MAEHEFLYNGQKYSLKGVIAYIFTSRRGKEPPSLYIDWGSHDLLVTGAQALSMNRTLAPLWTAK